MLRFNRLRVSGFKSFVDPTELLIESGLTGVVGPNGCGKSNLVEALKWTMGETSAKQMRGGEMDDVIFGGTANRPARNIAEVVLSLDNSARVAPAQFNDFDDLEISRRIEREKGSQYKVNGKDVRARDVQLLFADAATGARSTALVSQGRIGTVINAKPAQRRMLLEEAAGIIGLHSRRHEAELRLRGAETNLERLDDVLATLDVQVGSLRKQARQATRYRNLSDHIRKAEATLYHLRWTMAITDLEEARERLREWEAKVNDLTSLAGRASTKQAEGAAGLPQLRHMEAAAAAELQRFILAREALETEERRVAEQKNEASLRLRHTETDAERETQLAGDAKAAIGRLEEEQAAIAQSSEGEQAAEGKAAQDLEEASANVRDLETRVAALTDQVASGEAERSSLARTCGEEKDRGRRLEARAAEVAGERAGLEQQIEGAAELGEAEEALIQAQAALDDARAKAESAEAERARLTDQASEAADALRAAQAEYTHLKAEEQAIAKLVETGCSELFTPLIDALDVATGFEAGLGVALGEDLSAPADEPAPVHWRTLDPFADPPPLPGGVEPLSAHVKGPPALARRLGQIGVVADAAQGAGLAGRLLQGQRLVSREGGLWRWDGYTVAAGAPTPEAIRLEQRNRLAEVRGQLEAAEAEAARAEATAAQARGKANTATDAERETRQAVRGQERVYAHARDTLGELKEKAARQGSRLQALMESIANIESDLNESRRRAADATDALEGLPETAQVRDEVTRLRGELAEIRAKQVDCQAAYNILTGQAEVRRRRFKAIAAELQSWRERSAGADEHLRQLAERRQTAAEELERLEGRPDEIAAQRAKLAGTIESAEEERKAAADRLAEAEGTLAVVEQGLKAAEHELAHAREEMVRSESSVDAGKQACSNIAERIAEKLDCRPDDTAEIAEVGEGAQLPDLETTEKRLERLLRERETMGPVNLRAHQEMEDLSQQVETLTLERDDLIAAIEKLRQGINELNREGRGRLLASFKEVDGHFQELFVRLFGGGRAHLALVESDDPLEAGLEIMASPPGKRLQVMSLLSGGEQALTALALLFAVFLTNPAPICVLDEVDAPLDDANVDRFCSMLEEISHSGDTRFLIITHHRMTMARMDRLFGITMGERGVSQLVSVDLGQAERLRDSA